MEVDDGGGAEAEPREGRRRRRRRGLLAGLAIAVIVLAVGYLALLVVAPSIDRLHVARGGWRLYRCQRLGGSIPVDFPAMVRLHPDVTDRRSPVAVHDGDDLYVGEVVTLAGGGSDVAVWVAADRGGPARPIQAANDVAATVAANPDGRTDSPSAAAVEAATSCARRGP